MDTFTLLLYLEVQFICISIFVLLLVKEASGYNKSSDQIVFCWLLSSCIATFAFDAAWSLVNGARSQGLWALNYFLNICYYVALSANCYLFFLYSEFVQRSAIVETRQRQYLCAIPAIIVAVLAIVSPFTGALFYIDGAGEYQRGSLHFVQLILCYGYLVVTAFKALVLALQAKEFQRRRVLLVMAAFIVPVIIGGIFQTFLPGIPAIAAGCAISVLLVFINIQDQRISVDPLTQINNRSQLMSYLESRIAHAKEHDDHFALYLMDVNGFKGINDRYGHLEGDRALVRVGKALRTLKTQRSTGVFRYGGDEFIVVEDCDSEGTAERYCGHICEVIERQNADSGAPYELTVTVGYALFDPSMHTPQDLIKHADSFLYSRKSAKQNISHKKDVQLPAA